MTEDSRRETGPQLRYDNFLKPIEDLILGSNGRVRFEQCAFGAGKDGTIYGDDSVLTGSSDLVPRVTCAPLQLCRRVHPLALDIDIAPVPVKGEVGGRYTDARWRTGTIYGVDGYACGQELACHEINEQFVSRPIARI